MQRIFGPPFGSIPMQPPLPFQGGFMPQGGGLFPAATTPFSPTGAIGQGFGGPQALKGGGGLLARLFGGGASAGAGPMVGGLPAGGMNLTTILTNAQRVLGLTQQVMPMVQQYGPLIRNMPTIWRIMRSSNSAEEEPLEADESAEIPIQDEDAKQEQPSTAQSEDPLSKSKTIQGIPGPKLYV